MVQDPYLLNRHQIGCLKEFLTALALPAGTRCPFKVITHMADPNPRELREPGVLTSQQQKQVLQAMLAEHTALDSEIKFQHRRYSPLHMCYAYFTLDEANRALFCFERGLDMKDETTGKARGDSYILEFSPVPVDLVTLLQLS